MKLLLEYTDNYRFTLQHNAYTPEVIDEPVEYDSIRFEYSRHKKSDGIVFNQSREIKFVGNARTFLLLMDEYDDIKSKVRLLIDIRNPDTNDWERDEEGFLDFSTMETGETYISMKLNISGIGQVLKSRLNQQVELERLTTLNGNAMDPLITKRLLLSGRKIFLRSLLETLEENNSSDAFRMNFQGGNTRFGVLSVPTTITYSSDERITSTFKNIFSNDPATGEANAIFYTNNDINKILNITITMNTTIEVVKVDDLRNAIMRVELAKFTDGLNFVHLSSQILYTVPNPYNMNNHVISFTWTNLVYVQPGESLALRFYGEAKFGGTILFVDYDGDLKVNFNNIECSIDVQQDSNLDATQTNCLLPFEMGNRILEIITDEKDLMISDEFGRTDIGYEADGDSSLIPAYHGFWIRGFEQGDERYKGITTSWNDYIKSYIALKNLGYGIEIRNGIEKIIVDKKSYFYNRNVTIRLGIINENGEFEFIQVKNVKRTKIVDNYYSSADVGSQKGEEYDEIMGLDEYNGKSSFATCLDILQNVYEIICKYGRDSLGEELTRRKQKSGFGTTDTKRDKNIFVKDAKRDPATDVLVERFWQDDFDEEPTGIYNPDSATNLRLTQSQMLRNHGNVIASSFIRQPYEFVRYGGSTANDKLKAIQNGVLFDESGDVKNSTFDTALWINQRVEFEFPVDYDLKQLIKGKTTVQGKDIPNLQGTIEFKNENGLIEKGFFENLVVEETGKWELKRANAPLSRTITPAGAVDVSKGLDNVLDNELY